jgi:hypothetical protein
MSARGRPMCRRLPVFILDVNAGAVLVRACSRIMQCRLSSSPSSLVGVEWDVGYVRLASASRVPPV